jgi:DNA-binding transcriptional ArsR family regulator
MLFYEIVEQARPKFKTIMCVTNGHLVSETDARRLKALDVSVCVKLDTLNPKTHKALTGGAGRLKRTLDGLDMLKKYVVPTTLGSVVTPINYHDIPNVWRYAAVMGFAHCAANQRGLSEEESRNLIDELRRIDVEEIKREPRNPCPACPRQAERTAAVDPNREPLKPIFSNKPTDELLLDTLKGAPTIKGYSITQLAELIGIPWSTASWNMARLEKADKVEFIDVGTARIYRLKGDNP